MQARISPYYGDRFRVYYGRGKEPRQNCTSCDWWGWADDGRVDACPACASPITVKLVRRVRSKAGFRTREEAQAWLREALRDLEADDAGLTVGMWLDEWLETQQLRLQPATLVGYGGVVRRYLTPHIGTLTLSKLSTRRIDELYVDLLAHGGHKGKRLSTKTVRRTHEVLHKALADAVTRNLIADNPATGANVPTIDLHRRTTDGFQVWDAEQVRRFLDHVAGHRFEPVWTLALCTGMRRGELLGLRWEDVDGDMISVRRALSRIRRRFYHKEPKTSRARTLRIDATASAALDREKRRQEANREQCAERWRNEWGLVFTHEDGSPINPDEVTIAFRRVVTNAPVPTIRLHDTRHTHATLMLQAGAPVKVVSERLGHSTVSMTMDVYAHVLPAMDADAVARFSEHVFGHGEDVR